MNNKKNLILILTLFQCLSSLNVFATTPDKQSATSAEKDSYLIHDVRSRTGYKEQAITYSGRSSVDKQLYLDDLFVESHLRFPKFDRTLQPYYEWKRSVKENSNVQFGQDYTSLFQRASDSLTDEDSAAAGVYRFYGRWNAIGQGTKNTGGLVFKVEYSHKYGDVSPENFGADLGYLGSTGLLYSDLRWVLNDFNWQQKFNNGNGGFIVGRLDPNDYMDVVDYANPWTTFQNSNILENHSIAIPETSFGAGIGNWVNKHWYLKAAVTDANGKLDDPGVFEQGAEFFSFAEAGWAPDSALRDLKGAHVTIWHVDQRVEENVPEGEGVAIGGSWSFDKEWIIFGRFGQSTGEASQMRRSTTVGISHIWKAYFDVFGWAINYAEPVSQKLSEQTTMEMFFKVQLTHNIAITPSYQLLLDPALNSQHDNIQVFGLRLRITL